MVSTRRSLSADVQGGAVGQAAQDGQDIQSKCQPEGAAQTPPPRVTRRSSSRQRASMSPAPEQPPPSASRALGTAAKHKQLEAITEEQGAPSSPNPTSSEVLAAPAPTTQRKLTRLRAAQAGDTAEADTDGGQNHSDRPAPPTVTPSKAVRTPSRAQSQAQVSQLQEQEEEQQQGREAGSQGHKGGAEQLRRGLRGSSRKLTKPQQQQEEEKEEEQQQQQQEEEEEQQQQGKELHDSGMQATGQRQAVTKHPRQVLRRAGIHERRQQEEEQQQQREKERQEDLQQQHQQLQQQQQQQLQRQQQQDQQHAQQQLGQQEGQESDSNDEGESSSSGSDLSDASAEGSEDEGDGEGLMSKLAASIRSALKVRAGRGSEPGGRALAAGSSGPGGQPTTALAGVGGRAGGPSAGGGLSGEGAQAGRLSADGTGDAAEAEGLHWRPELPRPRQRPSSKQGLQTQVVADKEKGLAKQLMVPPRDPATVSKLKNSGKRDTAGKGWFDLPAQTIDADMKKELRLLRLRGAYDTKRFYKSFDSTKFPKHFAMGTVIEGPTDYYSGRLDKAQRKKATLTEQLLADADVSQSRKKRFNKLQEGAAAHLKVKKRKTELPRDNRPKKKPKH